MKQFVWFAVGVALGLVSAASAQVVVYDNLNPANSSGFSLNNGDTMPFGSGLSTVLIAEDITPAIGSDGQSVISIVYTITNSNTVPVSVRPLLRVFADNGSNAPGALLIAPSLGPVSLDAISLNTFTFAPGGSIFTIPAGGKFWAGLAFDDANGTTGVTAAQLDQIGQGMYNPPTPGTSVDGFFFSSGVDDISANNPAGSFAFSPFGGNPVANLGWQFTTAPIPEPGSTTLCVLTASGGFAVRHRRRSATRSGRNRPGTVATSATSVRIARSRLLAGLRRVAGEIYGGV